MAASSVDILVIAFSGLLALWLWARGRKANRLPHPPGPRGLPLIGNLLDLPDPRGFPWEAYRDWSRHYGESWITC